MRAVSILRPVPGRLRSVDLGAVSRRGEFLLAVSVLAIAVPVALQLWNFGLDIAEWDLLFVSGCTTVVIGLWLARGVRDRFSEMLKRLADRNALRLRGKVVTQADLTILKDAGQPFMVPAAMAKPAWKP